MAWHTFDKDVTARFRELRRRAVEAQDRDRELEFFAQEVRTGRFHAKGLPSRVPKVRSWRFWFGLAFGALSDFGRSLWRPLQAWRAGLASPPRARCDAVASMSPIYLALRRAFRMSRRPVRKRRTRPSTFRRAPSALSLPHSRPSPSPAPW